MMNWSHRCGKIFLLLVLLAGCARQPVNTTCKNGVPIGVVIASDTQEGREQREGYLVAVKAINDAGGINGCPVRMDFEPKTGSETSTETVQKALLDLDERGV